MINDFISRRNFIKLTAVCCVAAQNTSLASISRESNNMQDFSLIVDGKYVIINGWVLLKTDVAMV